MILPNPKTGVLPRIGPNVFIASNATIIGEVVIGANTNIWPNSVIRGDYGLIQIGKNCSIQDNTMLHTDQGPPLIVEDNVLVGHNVVLHGKAHISEYTMVGINSTALQGTKLGRGSILGAGAVTNKEFGDFSLILGVPGRLKKVLDESRINETKKSLDLYIENAQHYIKAGFNHPDLDKFVDLTL